MNPTIYLASADSEHFEPLRRTTFSAHGVGETAHLHKWILADPNVLGEELLVVTHEYAGFDRSRKRLDILALDRAGKLVVIELKLDTTGHFADLQAINYAAMVSTMLMSDVVRLRATHAGLSPEEAKVQIADFVGASVDELSELDDQPRVIIAAGGFGGLEITSTVLWLRGFGVDMKLVEIAPYDNGRGQLILVPRVVVPIPEAAAYMVGHEKKEEVQRLRVTDTRPDFREFMREVSQEFVRIAGPYSSWLEGGAIRRGRNYYSFTAPFLNDRRPEVHYEWVIDGDLLSAGLHFERTGTRGGGDWNSLAAEMMLERLEQESPEEEFDIHPVKNSRIWHWIGIPLGDVGAVELDAEMVSEAAQAMLKLVRATEGALLDVVEASDKARGDEKVTSA